MATERQGRWRNAIVVDIDCSIIKLHFAEDNTYEWLYRGSKRLGPFFSQSSRPQLGFQKRNDPSIEYITIDDDAEPQLEARPPPLIRAVAKKSTSKPPQAPQAAPQPQQVQPQVPIPPPAQPPGIKVKILNDDKIYIDDPAKVAKVSTSFILPLFPGTKVSFFLSSSVTLHHVVRSTPNNTSVTIVVLNVFRKIRAICPPTVHSPSRCFCIGNGKSTSTRIIRRLFIKHHVDVS